MWNTTNYVFISVDTTTFILQPENQSAILTHYLTDIVHNIGNNSTVQIKVKTCYKIATIFHIAIDICDS